MNRESNTYTIIYAAVMVIVVAIALALTSVVLKKPQQENVRIDKMQQILRSVNLSPAKAQVIESYMSTIKQELLVDGQGNIAETFEGGDIAKNEAFDMNTANQFKYRKDDPTVSLPVYVAEVDGEKLYILPMDGQGLWNVLWGYIAVKSDGSTVFGADFSHAGETPGLGAEITKPFFSEQFVGKQLYKGGTFKSIAVVKQGQSKEDQDYVDGISGGTLTSNGVNDMLLHSIGAYQAFLEKLSSDTRVAQ